MRKEMIELSEKDFERVENYLLGNMSEAEAISFEKEMEANAKLKTAVEEQKDMILTVESEGLRAELESIHKELYEDKPQKKKNPYLFFSIAASIAVLIAATFWFFYLNDANDDAYDKYAYVDPGLPVPMSATDSYDFYDAMVDYKTENYSRAINKWKAILEKETGNDTLNYYIGASYFNLADYEKSKPFLEKVARSEESTFVHKASYMLLLSEFNSGNMTTVRKYEPDMDSPFLPEIRAIQESVKK